MIYFREDMTISDVLEEIKHFYQNISKKFDRYNHKQRTAMQEIEAKKYLLKIAEDYDIPIEETEDTKKQLEDYIKMKEDLISKGEWDE